MYYISDDNDRECVAYICDTEDGVAEKYTYDEICNFLKKGAIIEGAYINKRYGFFINKVVKKSTDVEDARILRAKVFSMDFDEIYTSDGMMPCYICHTDKRIDIYFPDCVTSVYRTKSGLRSDSFIKGLHSYIYKHKLKRFDIAFHGGHNLRDASFMLEQLEFGVIDFSDFDLSCLSGCESMFHCKAKTVIFPKMHWRVMPHKMFLGSEIENLDFSNTSLKLVNSTSNMFDGAKIGRLDLSNVDVTEVSSFEGVFIGAEIGELILPKSKAIPTSLCCMFQSAKVDRIDLTNFDFSKCISFGGTFESCIADFIDMSSYVNTRGVSSDYMFFSCKCKHLKIECIPNKYNKSGAYFSSEYEYDFDEHFNKIFRSADVYIDTHSELIRDAVIRSDKLHLVDEVVT